MEPSGIPASPAPPASRFSSTDNTYLVQASDPASTGTGWKYTLKQYATSDCTGGATKSASKTFYVAQATVYADPALTTPKTAFAAGTTAYVTVTGVTPSLTGWSTTWLLPSGATACANTAGTDRADSSSSSNLPPKWTNSDLQYRPNTTATGSAWNREANYEVRPCPSFGTSNEGTWKLRLDGNPTNFVVLPVFTVDATPPPAPTITSAPADPSNAASASFGFSDTEAGVGFRCQLDGGGFGACSSPATYGPLGDGSHTFDVKAVDAAGNESGATTRAWRVDTTPPFVSLTTPADGSSTADATPSFSGSAGGANGDSSTVSVLVYSGASATGTPVRTLSTGAALDGSYSVAPADPLPNGTYTAQAQQVDQAGNTGKSTPNTFTVAVPAPPTNLSPPTISGTPQRGQSLTADAGTWSGTPPPTYSYQWRRCDNSGANCVDISAATGQSYLLTDDDVGATIRVSVTALNDVGSSAASSAQTQVVVVTVSGPSNTVPPTISGTAAVGETLAADPGQWSGAPRPRTPTSGVAATPPVTIASTSPVPPARVMRWRRPMSTPPFASRSKLSTTPGRPPLRRTRRPSSSESPRTRRCRSSRGRSGRGGHSRAIRARGAGHSRSPTPTSGTAARRTTQTAASSQARRARHTRSPPRRPGCGSA